MAVLTKQGLRIGVALLLAWLPSLAHAGEPLRLHEPEIKAGLLYNFLKYTDWPENAAAKTSPIAVCVFGADPFAGNLHAMSERTVNRRSILLRFIHSASESDGCHLLFVNAGEAARWPQLMQFLAGKSTLTVSDFPGFAASGGMIEFGRKDARISAEINMEAVAAGHLHVQDRMLKLVTIMRAGGG